MTAPNRLVFKVRSIAEEYAIIGRMLCPSCEQTLARETQTMIDGNDGRIKGDLLKLKCTNSSCCNQIEVFFYLPDDYDPFTMWKE
jgi:hypothetical protein